MGYPSLPRPSPAPSLNGWRKANVVDKGIGHISRPNERARLIRHSGIRLGEIIGYRAWRVIELGWGRFRRCDDRLRSVFVSDYTWDPDKPASGDVQMHGVYSFRNVIRSKEEYRHAV